MEKPTSEGVCLFCKKTFKKSGITRHLNTHLAKESQNGKAGGNSFHLKVEQSPRWGSGPWFLNLWIDREATLGDVDEFLRAIWLECCGHMSSFTNPQAAPQRGGMWDFFEIESLLEQGKIAEYEERMEAANGEIPKSRKLNDALKPDMKIDYRYDFGSTTELLITVAGIFPVKAPDRIVLLSRNEPLAILCELCSTEPACEICTVCMYEDSPSVFCKSCARKHAKVCNDFADYAAMPIVNSPRMGVCAYDGGSIDKARDGVYAKK
jgi:hypothetical protein